MASAISADYCWFCKSSRAFWGWLHCLHSSFAWSNLKNSCMEFWAFSSSRNWESILPYSFSISYARIHSVVFWHKGDSLINCFKAFGNFVKNRPRLQRKLSTRLSIPFVRILGFTILQRAFFGVIGLFEVWYKSSVTEKLSAKISGIRPGILWLA